MSLISAYTAILGSCVHVPQYDVYELMPRQRFQIKVVYGVNKAFWREFGAVDLEMDSTAPPFIVNFKVYERKSLVNDTDPIIHIGGYLATCDIPPPGLGTSAWLWMATLQVIWSAGAVYDIDYAHIQNYRTNSGSIGLIRYPLLPP